MKMYEEKINTTNKHKEEYGSWIEKSKRFLKKLNNDANHMKKCIKLSNIENMRLKTEILLIQNQYVQIENLLQALKNDAGLTSMKLC